VRCRLYVIDLGATHGTYVNGKRLDKHKPEKLTDGARLLIGQAPFAYRISRADGGGDKRKSDSNAVEPDSKRVRTLSAPGVRFSAGVAGRREELGVGVNGAADAPDASRGNRHFSAVAWVPHAQTITTKRFRGNQSPRRQPPPGEWALARDC